MLLDSLILVVALSLLHTHLSCANDQHEQYRMQDDILPSHIDISRTSSHGFETYAGVEYDSTCFEDGVSSPSADIAIVGAPFDTGVSARPGARYGPKGIRSGASRIGADFNWDLDGFNGFKHGAKIIDCGDVSMLPFDNRIALGALQKAHERVLSRPSKNSSLASSPRIITLGGDHTITLPSLRAARKTFGKVAVLHFDSHIDTWSPPTLPHNGPFTKYAGINHGTWGWHASHEELISSDSNIHVGIRAPYADPKKDLEIDRECGFTIIPAKSIDGIGVSGVVDAIKARVSDSKVYLSVDIDVLDPAYAPATGTPEPGGYTTRELLSILEGLEGLQIIGADVVEVAPVYDGPGAITSLAAAEITKSILGLMVKTPVQM